MPERISGSQVMKSPSIIRWSLFAGCLLCGLVGALLSDDSGPFVFAVFALIGIVLNYLFDYLGERLLFGAQLATELKQARNLLRETRRLLKRARKLLPVKTRERIELACSELHKAVAKRQLNELSQKTRELNALAESHLSSFRKAPWREYLEPIALAALVALSLRGFVIEAFEIPSGSMIPSLAVGDKIFVNKLAYGLRVPLLTWRLAQWSEPKRGEVVVFIYPLDPGENFVKRVVGLAGDLVELRDGFLYINGEAVPRRLLGQRTLWDKTRQNHWYESSYQVFEEQQDELSYLVLSDPKRMQLSFPPTRVPKDHLFVLGDNRDNSSDSREWGMVPTRNLVGRSMFIWWSYGPRINSERFFRWVR